jgi:PAS domain S-box-containing protein
VVAKLAEWAKKAGEKTSHLQRLNIGSRLTLCFIFIILAMLVGNAVLLWQFQRAREQAERLSGVDQELIAVLQAHTNLMSFYDRLDALAYSENTAELVMEAEPLRNALLEDSRRSRNVLSRLPPEVQLDPTLLPTLEAIQDALPAELEAITVLATSKDWQAVRLRLANQVRPLEFRTLVLVESIDREVGEKRAQALLKIADTQRRILLIVPVTAILTLLFAGLLGVAITRSITRPLGLLMEGSKALAGGDFSHRVPAAGKDEIARLGSVFNEMIARLQELYSELQSREAYLAEAQTLSHTGSFGWDLSSGEVYWSQETFRIFECELTTKPTIEQMLQRTHPEDRAAVDQLLERVSHDRIAFDFEHRLLTTVGNVKYLRVVGHPSTNERDSFDFVGAVTDITERKHFEEALRRSEAYLAEAQRLTHTGSWALRTGTGPLYWSEENSRIWGFDPQQGAPTAEMIFQRIHPEDRDRFAEYGLKELIREGRDYAAEGRIVLPDGTVKHIHSFSHPVFSASGELIEIVGTHVDITERKRTEGDRERLRQLEAELAHVNRVSMLGELAASLSHELAQPIMATTNHAKASLRWLQRDPPDLTQVRKGTESIIEAGTFASEIINRLRSLYKTGSPPERELVDVNEAVHEMLAMLRNEADRHSVSMRSMPATGLPLVWADRVQIQQVLLNLMLNAIEAMKETGGELTIASEFGSDCQVLISVSDTGVGLPVENADHIFKAFFTTKPQGSGMGLAISRSIVESHGGRLWATANSKRGASFCFTLPAAVAEVKETGTH